MMPFDLIKAKQGHPMRTRDGRKAVFVTRLTGNQPAPVLVNIWYLGQDRYGNNIDIPPTGEDSLENFDTEGRYNGAFDNDLDLFMED